MHPHTRTRHPQPDFHPPSLRRQLVPAVRLRSPAARLFPEEGAQRQRLLHGERTRHAELHACHQPRHPGHAVHRFRKASRQAQRPRPGSTPRSALRCDRQVPPLRRPPLHRHRNAPQHRPAQSELHLVRNHRRINQEKQYKTTNRQA